MVTDGRKKNIGLVIFDEVKKKEGLVNDLLLGKLVGFVYDSRYIECDDELHKLLATDI